MAALLSVPTQGRYPSSEHDPQQRKERTYRTLIYLLERLTARQPVLIVFEDLHWADPSTLELLDRLAAKAENLPVLLLSTGRPGFSPPWLDDAHVTLLTLSRISRRDCYALLDALAGRGSLPESVVDEIAAKSDGVPLFVEEMARAVVEARTSELTASMAGGGVAVPVSLQDLLMARLDRLTFGKSVAQIAAAIGREFRRAALEPICDLSQRDLDRALDELTAVGLLSRRGAAPNVSYVFKHALVQDAAYSSLLRVNRQKIHHRIVTTLGEDLIDQPAVLAHHWECAGELGHALEYRLAAGRGATNQHALWEAIGQYWCALSLLEQIPETEATRRRHLEVVVALIGTGLMFWQSAAERAKALEHIEKALDTAKKTADLANLARLEAFKGNYWHDETALRQAQEHAAADGNERLRAEVARRYAGYLGRIGKFETSHAYVERAIGIYAGLGAAFDQGMAMAVEGRCYHARAGEIGRSLHFARHAAEIAEATGDLRLKAWLAMESEPYMYQGLWKQAVEVVEQNLRFAWEIGNWGVILFASAWATIAYLKLDRLAEARALIERAVTIAARRTAYEHHQIYPQIALAQMHLLAGETEASLLAGHRALALAERAQHKMEEGAAHRILGQACETKRNSEEAEAHFQQSLGLLRAIQSRPELAQSLLAFGRLKLRDDPAEGRRLLGDGLALFEEMDATGWIEETRAVLDASS